MNLKINRLQHVGIPVTDISRSQTFYEAFGFKNVMPATFQYKGGQGTVAMMQLDEIIIELYQMPQAGLEAIRSRGDGHIDHIAFDVDDIDTAFKTLQEASYNILEEAPVYLAFWNNGCKYFNITGPDGERLEFNQIL